MSEKIKIFLDMDGVLADFQHGVKTYYDIDLEAMNKMKEVPNILKKKNSAMWGHIRKNPQFWNNLKPMDDAQQLWDYFSHLDPIILTAAPSTFSVGSETFLMVGEMKKTWIKRIFNMSDDTRFICTTSSRKHQHVIDSHHNVLIDDNTKNISNWTNTGNIGILHKTASKSIKEYESHFNSIKNNTLKLK